MHILDQLDEASVGERIRAYRRLQGLTQKDLSRITGISYHHLGKIERGIAGIGVKYLSGIAKALGVKTSHLMGEVPFLYEWPKEGTKDEFGSHCSTTGRCAQGQGRLESKVSNS